MARWGEPLLRFATLASTNSYLREREELCAQHGLVVVAEQQTAGRGRAGRAFHSLPGGTLTASLVIHTNDAPVRQPMWALWSGLALWRVLCRLGVSDARLKWPNDVWIGARKVAGILVESGPWRVADLQSLIIGIGVNIHGSPHDFPPDLEHKVTTLARELQQAPSVALVLQSWLDELQAISQELKRHGPAILLQEWEQGAQLQGQAVHLETVQGTLQGIVEGLHEHGFLRVRLADGRQHLHTSGDVWWSEHKA